MNLDFSTRKLSYADRTRNLTIEAAGVVKSEKHYPVFDIDGKEFIKQIERGNPLPFGGGRSA